MFKPNDCLETIYFFNLKKPEVKFVRNNSCASNNR